MCPVVHSSQSLHTGYTTPFSLWSDFCNTAKLKHTKQTSTGIRRLYIQLTTFTGRQTHKTVLQVYVQQTFGDSCNYAIKILVYINTKTLTLLSVGHHANRQHMSELVLSHSLTMKILTEPPISASSVLLILQVQYY